MLLLVAFHDFWRSDRCSFAVLLTGGGGADCDDDDDGYIFDAGWKDGVLVGSVFIAIAGVCFVVILIALLFPNAVGRAHGKEYTRIRSLRSGRDLSASSVVP